MNAFGAFIKKTEIDFRELNKSGLFLITGPTGSGKTTILDAITFALFGEASGDKRQTENFKSDYSELSDLCFVSLEFELKQKKYIIERYPKQQKKSTRVSKSSKNSNIITVNSKARLIFEDETEIVGADNVNKKITELFGMTYKQFKQIIILPQGEFQKLLESKSEEKQEIFRKIFDTNIYESFSKILSEKTKEIQKNIESEKLLINSYINSIDITDDEALTKSIFEFLSCLNSSSNFNLDLLILDLKNNIKILESKTKKQKNNINLLENQKNNINQKISEIIILKDKKLKLENLKNKLDDKNNIKIKLKQELGELKNKLEKLSESKKQIPDLIYQKSFLNNQLDFLKKLNNLKSEYNLNLEKKSDIILKINQTKEAEKKLILKNELNSQQNIIIKLRELITSIDVYLEIYQEYKDTEKQYLISYESFLAGQAGFLAQKLKDKTPCPVCGSLEHPNKACLINQTPSESTVNSLSIKTKKLRDKIADLDLKLAENYNFIKENIKENIKKNIVFEIKYQDILKNKDYFIKIFDFYKELEKQKKLELDNIKINIKNLDLESLQKSLQEFNNQKLVLDTRLDSIKLEIKELEIKLSNLDSFESINLKIQNIDKKILELENLYKDSESNYLKIKTLDDKNTQEIRYLTEEIDLINLDFYKNNIDNLENIFEKLENLKLKNQEIDNELEKTRNEYMILSSRLNINIKQYENIKNTIEKYISLCDEYSEYATLSDISNGKNPQRISFERYILASYFQDVIDAANIKFSEMTGFRYLLKRKEDKEKNNRASGLDLEIIDNYTGKTRNINTLSGGESFKASLCLALGLANVVQTNAGGVEIDTLFIDEGFGTLDSESLDVTIEALMSLKKSGRLIGIISHVSELKERIPTKLLILPSKTGSVFNIIN
ncbi:MAG: SMC family ATPase [Oscillospiraceae bacterium]|nr:SMC family ATPase [Oscillospiraceae bacterium]